MIILGIDPSLSATGWGVINVQSSKLQRLGSGVIITKAEQAMTIRLTLISTTIEEVIAKYQPDIVAMEETFVNMNAGSSLKLGYARGAIMATIGKANLQLKEFKPNEIKKTIVGSGHAEKQQVLHMVKLLIKDTAAVSNLDESDALAVAYTCSVYNR